MNQLSKLQMYEEAKEIRDKIARFDYIVRPQIPAEAFLENPNLTSDIRDAELSELKQLLRSGGIGIPNLKRIECFDISHISGASTAASMVTFIKGEPEKRLYRQFKINNEKKGDDYASLGEVAERRFLNIAQWGKPNLMIIDGGLGQIKQFIRVFKNSIPIVGIAKNPDRIIFLSGKKIVLSGKASNLVTRIRNEAHRFARKYHHKLFVASLHP